MANQPGDLSMLAEIIARLKSKSPKLFVVIQWITGVCTFITGLPELIDYFIAPLGVQLPQAFLLFENNTIAVATAVGYIIAKLPVSTPAATNNVLKAADDTTPGTTLDGGGTDPNKPQPPKP